MKVGTWNFEAVRVGRSRGFGGSRDISTTKGLVDAICIRGSITMVGKTLRITLTNFKQVTSHLIISREVASNFGSTQENGQIWCPTSTNTTESS